MLQQTIDAGVMLLGVGLCVDYGPGTHAAGHAVMQLLQLQRTPHPQRNVTSAEALQQVGRATRVVWYATLCCIQAMHGAANHPMHMCSVVHDAL